MVKLFSKNSNLCDHNSPTSQRDRRADGQTDRQTTCDRNTALCTKVHRAVKIRKFSFSNRVVDIWNCLSALCVNSGTIIGLTRSRKEI